MTNKMTAIMSYTTHHFPQGSEAWHAHRASHFNGSEAAAMLGISPYLTRSELVKQKALGIVPEVSVHTQRLFDRGHAIENAARPRAEMILGDLYPVTASIAVDGLPLSASYDGATFDNSMTWECKTINQALAASMAEGFIPDSYKPQLEQGMMIIGASRCLFTAATENGEDERHCWYMPDPELRARIISGWKQFAIDRDNYKFEAAPVEAIGRTPETLPALRIEVTGMVTASNLDMFREHALAVFGGINRTLVTDQDFATAKTTVKWFGEVETRLAAAKQHALSQTESIDALFRTIDAISEEARKVRLELDKLVYRREAEVKTEMVGKARAAYLAHEASLQAETGAWVVLPAPDFAGAIKGKRSLALMQGALDDALAEGKIAADASARKIRANIACIDADGAGFEFLFSDRTALIAHPLEHLQLLIQSRIAKHKEAEAAKEEATRARIRAEEIQRADREAMDKLQATYKRELAAQVAVTSVPAVDVILRQPPLIPASQPPVRATVQSPTLKLGTISERLGFTLTEAFLRTLGFEPAALNQTSKLYHESDFPLICDALMEHIAYVQTKYEKVTT